MEEKKYIGPMPDKKYFGQLNELPDNASPYQQLEWVLILMERYGKRPEEIYAIVAYGRHLGLPGFDRLEELYRSRLMPEKPEK
ncbi:MAG: hypothetical protein N3D75_01690 [Candidatus Aenigmarchaeota archaeon]|nr:hypothetical protein [Candidatus Aenigmarchaeota archaeon]